MENNETKIPCSKCGDEVMSCASCQLDVIDGYLPLEVVPDKYGRTGKQYDNSDGTF